MLTRTPEFECFATADVESRSGLNGRLPDGDAAAHRYLSSRLAPLSDFHDATQLSILQVDDVRMTSGLVEGRPGTWDR
jgi:hypothetical protein